MGTLLALVLGAVASLGALAALRRPCLGRFVITTDDERSFSFVTDTGRFRIEFEKRELTLRAASGTRSIPLDQVERLDFAHAEQLALLEEIGRSGRLGFASFAERVHWLTLWIVLAGGERVELYAIGQLEAREPWLASLFAIESALLARLGLLRDVEQTARKVLERVRSGFARCGLPLGLT